MPSVSHLFVGDMDQEAFLLSATKDRKSFKAISSCLLEIREAVKNVLVDVMDRPPRFQPGSQLTLENHFFDHGIRPSRKSAVHEKGYAAYEGGFVKP